MGKMDTLSYKKYLGKKDLKNTPKFCPKFKYFLHDKVYIYPQSSKNGNPWG